MRGGWVGRVVGLGHFKILFTECNAVTPKPSKQPFSKCKRQRKDEGRLALNERVASMCYVRITFDPALFNFAQYLYLYMHREGEGVSNLMSQLL